MRWQHILPRAIACAIGLAATASGPALGQENTGITADPGAQIELRFVQSDLDFDEGEDFDSSGFSLRAKGTVDFDLGETTVARIEVEGRQVTYNDASREDRTSYGGAVQVEQQLSETVSVRLRARHIENVALLEANSADQTSVGLRVQWQKGNDRVRFYADYRDRDYDLTAPANGDGWRYAAQYNRRLGSYHWLRLDARYEEISSDNSPRRSFDRFVARVKYSVPIAKRLRFRPSIEYRTWSYDGRVAVGDPDGDLRRDSYVAPAIEFTYGRASSGLYASANAQYRLRSSNDVRFDSDAIRLSATVGFRF